MLKAGDFDWDEIFAGGVRWFHSGGIFAALSPTTPEVIVEGMKAAKKAGAITSFDLNYRAKLVGNQRRPGQSSGNSARHRGTLRRAGRK
jgi:sugar/nucleoside kinase (ribokinase family)